MPEDTGAYVSGLRDLRRALATVDKELAKGLRLGLKALADYVRDQVREAVPEGPRPKPKSSAGPWKSKIGSGATQQSAYVTWGRKTVPQAGWLEFGGRKRVRGGGVANRERVESGRYVYPTVKRAEPRVVQRVEEIVDEARKKAGLD